MPVLFDRPGRRAGQLLGRSPYMQAIHAVAPADHIYMADAAAWDKPCDGLPQFLATRAPNSSSSQGEG